MNGFAPFADISWIAGRMLKNISRKDETLRIFKWLAVTFSMYTKIPMPRFAWQEDDVSHSLLFFPLVGVLIGGLICLLNAVSPFRTLHPAVRILLTLAIPLLVTGGFHADGFMDTQDALHSYASSEKKQEILKDPHIGAFAVISLIKWMLLYAAAIAAILLHELSDHKAVLFLGLSFVASRALSGLTSLLFQKARKDGMLFRETEGNTRSGVLVLSLWLFGCLAFLVSLNVCAAAALLLTLGLFTVYYRKMTLREFGGVSGDTAGYFLMVCEIISALIQALSVYCLPHVSLWSM